MTEINEDYIPPGHLDSNMCQHICDDDRGIDFICTRVKGHEGAHIAHGLNDEMLHSWPQYNPKGDN